MSTTTFSRPAGGRRPARLTVRQYEAMAAWGAFGKEDRIELIEGILLEKVTKSPPRAVTVGLCDDLIRDLLPPGWHTRQEDPIRIPERDSMPEPDLAIARGRRRDWTDHHPGPEDVALVVEVADSSVEDDRAMATTYGGGGVPVYWLVNLRDRQLEVYTEPSGSAEPVGYRRCEVLSPGDDAPLVIEGREVARIPVADLFPPSRDGSAGAT